LIKVGAYELLPVETGRFALDGGAMFGVVPKNLWSRSFPSDEENRIPLALRSLILKSNKRTILIDTGIGNKFDEKFGRIFNIDFNKYTIENSLRAYRIRNDEITDVILTHLHFDHAGGTTEIKDGLLQLSFPNAVHHIQEEHWDWANHPSEKDRASFLKNDYMLLEKSSLLNKLTGPTELFPGIELLVMYGHTQAMQIVKISDKSKTVLFCADLIPTASHIPFPWVMAYDNHPLTTMNEKRSILPRAAEEDWILFFEHDPHFIASTVIKTDKGFIKDKTVIPVT